MTGAEIKEMRLRLGWSQAKLADEMMVTERTVQTWEADDNTPPPTRMQRLERLDKLSRKRSVRNQGPIRNPTSLSQTKSPSSADSDNTTTDSPVKEVTPKGRASA